MGYRSDVRIAIKAEDYEELLGRLPDLAENIRDFIKDIDESVLIHNEVMVFGWNSVKWYPGYPDVDFIEDFITEIEDKGHPYKMIIIGEEPDDIETRYSLGENGDDYSCEEVLYTSTCFEIVC